MYFLEANVPQFLFRVNVPFPFSGNGRKTRNFQDKLLYRLKMSADWIFSEKSQNCYELTNYYDSYIHCQLQVLFACLSRKLSDSVMAECETFAADSEIQSSYNSFTFTPQIKYHLMRLVDTKGEDIVTLPHLL